MDNYLLKMSDILTDSYTSEIIDYN